MYKLCKTERSAKRQREIEHALLDLMTERHYETISVTELCEKMVMPRCRSMGWASRNAS